MWELSFLYPTPKKLPVDKRHYEQNHVTSYDAVGVMMFCFLQPVGYLLGCVGNVQCGCDMRQPHRLAWYKLPLHISTKTHLYISWWQVIVNTPSKSLLTNLHSVTQCVATPFASNTWNLPYIPAVQSRQVYSQSQLVGNRPGKFPLHAWTCYCHECVSIGRV